MMAFKHLSTRYVLALLLLGLLLQRALYVLYQHRLQQSSQQQVTQIMQQADALLVQQLQQQQLQTRAAVSVLLRQQAWLQSGMSADEQTVRQQLRALKQTLQADSIALVQAERVVTEGMGQSSGLSHARARVAATSRQLQFDVRDGRLQLVLWWPLVSESTQADWLMLTYPLPALVWPSMHGEPPLTLTAFRQDARQQWQAIAPQPVQSASPASSAPHLIAGTLPAQAALTAYLNRARGLLLIRQTAHYDGLLGHRLQDQYGHALFIGLHGQFHQLWQNEQHWLWLWGWSLLLTLLIWLLALAYVCRDITRVLANLRTCMAEAEAGNPGNMMPLPREDELGQLVDTYNRMVTTITRRHHTLQQLAFEDATTQLANRQALEAALQQHLETPSTQGQPLAVLVLSISAYPAMLQSMGQAFCNAVLQMVANQAVSQLPTTNDIVARWDEQSFALLCHIHEPTALAAFADALLHPFAAPVTVQGQLTHVRLRLGIACYPEHGQAGRTLLLRAEAAQQLAQQQQALWALYQPEMDEANDTALHISRLQTALRDQQLQLRLMPVLDCQQRTVVAMQAELHWPDNEAAQLSNLPLLQLAEDTGLVQAVTDWQLTQACAAMVSCQQLNWPLPLCLPLSPRALQQADFASELLARLSAAHIPLPALQLQFSTRRLHPLSPRALTQLQQLSAAGMLIMLTEMGDSALPLSTLLHYAPGALALAPALLTQLSADGGKQASVKACLAMAAHLKLPVTAMGVSDEQTLLWLNQAGCDFACGPDIAAAMRMQDFPVWLARWREEQTSPLRF